MSNPERNFPDLEERRAAGRERYRKNADEWNRKKRERRMKDLEKHREREREYQRRSYHSQCPEARRKRNKENWAKNREAIIAKRRADRYGLEEGEFEAMLKSQDGVCKICKRPETTGRWRTLSVDHCHGTGVVRGLLCRECNLAVAMLEKHWDRVDLMKAYVEEFRVISEQAGTQAPTCVDCSGPTE